MGCASDIAAEHFNSAVPTDRRQIIGRLEEIDHRVAQVGHVLEELLVCTGPLNFNRDRMEALLVASIALVGMVGRQIDPLMLALEVPAVSPIAA